jgi:MinD-like ATPase involved in chromosome partitioning or flagellar assembly
VTDRRLCALLLAGGAGWEADALQALGDAGVVVTKRCVDVPDLMASASAGGAAVAIVAAEVPQLDAEAVMHLLAHDVRTLGVTADGALADRLRRLGVGETCTPDVATLVAAVQRVAAQEVVPDPEPAFLPEPGPVTGRGRVVAVWGPAGAPGRTTVAVGLADALADEGRHVVLVDADPYGGTVAQHLGVLEEVSGVLAVSRMANLGTLDEGALVRCCRRVGDRISVLTGLPRADRRVEVRPGVLGTVLDVAAGLGEVVVDCGFALEDPDLPLARDRMTLDVLGAADEVVVVGSAEPSGLARLARGLVELRDVAGGTHLRVVVNRMRPTLGWSERDIVGMVEGYAGPVAVHFLPEDGATVDRSLVGGRTFTELGESRLAMAFAGLAAAVLPTGVAPEHRGRARSRWRVAR